MKLKKVLFLPLIILSACGKTPGIEVKEYKLDDLSLSITDLDYDFASGLSFLSQDGINQSYSIESNVILGVAGKYQVKYKLEYATYTRDVYIYGTPSFEVLTYDIPYLDVVEGNYTSTIKAKDTFGGALSFSCISTPSLNNCGQIEVGNQDFKFKTSDRFCNYAEQQFTLNILESSEPLKIVNCTIDYSSPYYTLNLDGQSIVNIYFNGSKLSEDYYLTNNGYLLLNPNFVKQIGKGNTKEVFVNCNKSTIKLVISVTDSKPATYEIINEIEGKSFFLDDSIELPQVRLANSSIQNVEAKYFVEIGNQKTQINNGIFQPNKGGDYQFIVDLYRDGNFVESIIQSFSVEHYFKKPIDLDNFVGVNETYDLSVRTDYIDIPVTYQLTNNNNVLEINGHYLNVKKEGTATLTASINQGEIVKSFELTAVDFKNHSGKVRDFSNYRNVWKALDDTTLTNGLVNDVRNSASNYTFNALSASGDVALSKDIIEAARKIGYKNLQFTLCLEDSNRQFNVSNLLNNQIVGEPLISEINTGKWTYYSLPLNKIQKDCDLLFKANSSKINIAKVEFVSVDISAYANPLIVEVSSSGKSVDLICDETLNSLFLTTCNTNNMFTYTNTGCDRNSSKATDNGDYFTFSRTGFYSTYGTVENDIYVSSDWIMAAKNLNYSTIGFYIYENVGYSFLKRCSNGQILNFKNKGAEWHAKQDAWSFISLDLTSFQEGDVIIFSCGASEVKISGATFRKQSYGEPNLTI